MKARTNPLRASHDILLLPAAGPRPRSVPPPCPCGVAGPAAGFGAQPLPQRCVWSGRLCAGTRVEPGSDPLRARCSLVPWVRPTPLRHGVWEVFSNGYFVITRKYQWCEDSGSQLRGNVFPGETRCWRLDRSGISPCVPGHVRCGVPGMINHTPQGREGVMEVEPRQLEGAAASPNFSFRLEGNWAVHREGAPGRLFSLPHLLHWVFPFPPCFPRVAEQPLQLACVRLSVPMAGSPAGGRASPRGTAGA